ncbi:CHAP domain-containing protein [Salmonella enterica subsp. enterica]|nr:CHAP domain-containing protein [Salmonella enterica subsp. enterica]EAW9772791.1 CHAP domain-containing protein [Salmonella enterica]
MSWDKYAAVAFARRNAYGESHKKCELFVKEAVIAGGINLAPTPSAKDMGPHLILAGFHQVYGEPVLGDIAVIQSIPHHPDGHACIFDGQQWISDFVQRTMYPGQAYRTLHPAFKLYRHD